MNNVLITTSFINEFFNKYTDVALSKNELFTQVVENLYKYSKVEHVYIEEGNEDLSKLVSIELREINIDGCNLILNTWEDYKKLNVDIVTDSSLFIEVDQLLEENTYRLYQDFALKKSEVENLNKFIDEKFAEIRKLEGELNTQKQINERQKIINWKIMKPIRLCISLKNKLIKREEIIVVEDNIEVNETINYTNLVNDFSKKRIIVVSHDASMSGAPLLTYNIAKTLKEDFNYEVLVLVKNGGVLLSKFESVAHTVVDLSQTLNYLDIVKQFGSNKAICSTVVSTPIVKDLSEIGIKTISLIHELPSVIRNLHLEDNLAIAYNHAYKVVYSSNYVKEIDEKQYNLKGENTLVLPQGLYENEEGKVDASFLTENHGISKDKKVILCVANFEYRKGFDYFVKIAKYSAKIYHDLHFVWVGIDDSSRYLDFYGEDFITQPNITLVENTENIYQYYLNSDIFMLTSREDPFPSVLLEAMNVGLPVVAFENSGGFVELIDSRVGALVEKGNCLMMLGEVNKIISNGLVYNDMSINAKMKITNNYNFQKYVSELVRILN